MATNAIWVAKMQQVFSEKKNKSQHGAAQSLKGVVFIICAWTSRGMI